MSQSALPFELVDKSDRKSPLQQMPPTRCNHNRAYATEEYPTSGVSYVCANCGMVTQWPRDFKGGSP